MILKTVRFSTFKAESFLKVIFDQFNHGICSTFIRYYSCPTNIVNVKDCIFICWLVIQAETTEMPLHFELVEVCCPITLVFGWTFF